MTEFILIVHDDAESAQSIQSLMRLGRIVSRTASSEAEALKVLGAPDAWAACVGCVIDMRLPEGLDAGTRLAKWIRQQERGPSARRKRIVGVTAHTAAAKFGPDFDVGLHSPYSPADLLEAFAKPDLARPNSRSETRRRARAR